MRLFGRRRQEDGDSIPRISVEQLKQRLDRGEDVVVLDARQPHAYAEYPGAIPGSVRIPPAELPDRYDSLPRGRLLVPY